MVEGTAPFTSLLAMLRYWLTCVHGCVWLCGCVCALGRRCHPQAKKWAAQVFQRQASKYCTLEGFAPDDKAERKFCKLFSKEIFVHLIPTQLQLLYGRKRCEFLTTKVLVCLLYVLDDCFYQPCVAVWLWLWLWLSGCLAVWLPGCVVASLCDCCCGASKLAWSEESHPAAAWLLQCLAGGRQFFSTCSATERTMKVLRADGHIQFLLCEVVPALCAFNDDDQVLWISEPGECVPVRGVGLCVDERSWPAWPVVLTRG